MWSTENHFLINRKLIKKYTILHLIVLDQYPRQYQTNCSPAIRLIQAVQLIQPLQPLTAHQTAKIQLYPSKYFSTRVKTSGPFQKHFKFLSLPSQVSFLDLPKTPFSLSPTDDAGTPTKCAPSPVANGPTSSESSKLSGTLSFSLYPSLPHSFSHLTSLISQVLLLREMMPFFLIFEVTIRSYFYQHNPMDWYFLVRFSSPLFSGS